VCVCVCLLWHDMKLFHVVRATIRATAGDEDGDGDI